MTRVLVGAAVAWVALLAVHATGQTQTPQSGGPLPGITATEFSEFRHQVFDELRLFYRSFSRGIRS